jgi:hypothetical protein
MLCFNSVYLKKFPVEEWVIIETCGGVDVYIHVFLTSALVEGEWSDSRLGRFATRRKSPR